MAKKDMRSPLAKARDEWLESDEGRLCKQGPTEGEFLRNRLAVAFIAGWTAAERAKGGTK